MDKGTALKIIIDFRKALESKSLRVKKIILYGSYATGEFREGSDIDLIVISEDFENKSYWERIELLSDAIYKVFKPIEAVAMTPEEWEREDSMIAGYARNGEIVYAA